jgi:hypothetical protein
VVIIESALIVLALVSLWPLLWSYHETWYRVWLVLMVGVMAWVASRRVGRIRAAADHAKRMRDEMERGGRPPRLK